MTGEGVRRLLPSSTFPGCVHLARLLLFDCAVFEKELAKVICIMHLIVPPSYHLPLSTPISCPMQVVPLLPHLEYLGYKETGKVVRSLHRAVEEGGLVFK